MTSLWHVRGLVIAALLLVLFVWLFSRDEEIKIPERRKHAQRDHRPRDRGVTPATSREPVLESQVESTAALPTTRASLAPSNAAPIRVAWLNRKMNLFYRADPILDILENVSGLRATLIAPGGGAFAHDAVDVFLIQANYLTDVKKVRLAHSNHSLFLFVATEPLFDGNNFLAVSDVSFGQAPLAPNGIAACTSASAAHHFLRTPLWVFGVVNCSALPVAPCGVSEELRAASQIDPASWAARPNFALHVARHGGFPRELLLSAFRKTATRLSAAQAGAAGSAGGSAAGSMLQSLARRKRRVDCPGPGGDGREFQNMRWPKHVPDSAVGKLLLLRDYRFSIQPENVRTPCQGYMSEKVPEGLKAGAVPVHWGDPIDDTFWNPARILSLDVAAGNGTASVMARVERLETNATFRAEFFREPALQPSADAWVEKWSASAARLLRIAIRLHPLLGTRWHWV